MSSSYRSRPLHINRVTWWTITACLCTVAASLSAEEEQRTPAVWYSVDPDWPQRPDSVTWGPMPGVAVDQHDQVWIFTRANPPIQVYDQSGKLVRAFGEEIIGKSHHIKIDHDGNVWVTDIERHQVFKFSPEGKLLLELGTRGEAGVDDKHFNQPTDVAVAPSGDVFISDGYGNSRVVHVDKDGKFVKAWGQLGSGPGEFNVPHAITMDQEGRLYVADRNNGRVQIFDQRGVFLNEWRNLLVPWGFATTPEGAIWVCGSSPMSWGEADAMLGVPPKDQVLMKFEPSGKLLQLWAVPKGEDGLEKPGELNWVHAIAVDSQGNLYAGDIMGQRVQKFVRRQ